MQKEYKVESIVYDVIETGDNRLIGACDDENICECDENSN